MSMLDFSMKTPHEMARLLAQRVKELRLARAWTQATLATRAGVTLASYRRFESTGNASLALLLQVCMALGRLAEFDQLLQPPPARTMKELLQTTATPRRKRGRS